MLERAERCLAMAAFYILRDGDRREPILEAMEQEAERVRAEGARLPSPEERAQRILENHKRITRNPRRLAIAAR